LSLARLTATTEAEPKLKAANITSKMREINTLDKP
jgi:hypothetical protein